MKVLRRIILRLKIRITRLKRGEDATPNNMCCAAFSSFRLVFLFCVMQSAFVRHRSGFDYDAMATPNSDSEVQFGPLINFEEEMEQALTDTRIRKPKVRASS